MKYRFCLHAGYPLSVRSLFLRFGFAAGSRRKNSGLGSNAENEKQVL